MSWPPAGTDDCDSLDDIRAPTAASGGTHESASSGSEMPSRRQSTITRLSDARTRENPRARGRGRVALETRFGGGASMMGGC